MRCVCNHMAHQHGWVTYPKHRRPCRVCQMCGATSRDCCLTPAQCRCTDFTEAVEVKPEPASRWEQDEQAGAIG